jgi:4-amino-4-deoxy-L-arabinose transferase-like glycosyltransferase
MCELTSDEADSWYPAAGSNFREVLQRSKNFNPGKLALHDLCLHYWMLAFGDSVVSLRASSAVVATISIMLVFLVTLELFGLGPDASAQSSRENRQSVAALTSLAFAFNPIAIGSARDARMYALTLAMTLGQIWFFLRALRAGGLVNYAGAGVFSVATAAANLAGIVIFPAEGVGFCICFGGMDGSRPRRLRTAPWRWCWLSPRPVARSWR